MNVSEHFDIREFVTPDTWSRFGENSVWFIDERLIRFSEWVMGYFGAKPVINNWHTGGVFKESGLRDPNTPTGAKYSQHKRGTAIDIKIDGVEPELIRQEIRNMFTQLNTLFGITTIEMDTPSWCHVDLRWTNQTELLEVPYK